MISLRSVVSLRYKPFGNAKLLPEAGKAHSTVMVPPPLFLLLSSLRHPHLAQTHAYSPTSWGLETSSREVCSPFEISGRPAAFQQQTKAPK